MRTKLLSVMLVLGLVAVGFSVFGFVSAGTAHVVDVEVGPSNAAGPTNPANAASIVLYLVNKPAEPIQTQGAPVPLADGTNYASFGVDVGSPWNWAAGDTVVAVVETVAGTNGWTGANQTASSNMALTNANVDSTPRANLEAIPSLTLVRASTYVDVQWTALAASNTDVKNYTVSRQTDGGGWVVLGRSGPHTSGAAMAFNDTTVAIGHRYCYSIAVNYRRDNANTLWYTTTGTSPWACATIATAPVITDTSPANLAIDVPVGATVYANFSLRMDPATVFYTIAPGIGLTPTWNVAGTSLALDHVAPFAQGTLYTVRITSGQDMTNHMPLAAGPAPNPWFFTTYSPSAQISNTTPWNLQRGVPLTAPIVVTFTKAMNPATVTATLNPNPGGLTSTWPTTTELRVAHNAFAANTQYTVTIADPVLVAGAVPNPWSFTTNAAPTGAVTAPVATSDWTGGSSQTIAWTMADDVPLSVDVWINYTAGGAPVVIVGRTPHTASPATYTWNPVASINSANVIVTVDVVDAAGGKVTLSSLPFTIDSTVPTATTSPTSGATGVGITDDVVITFSEAMAKPATEGAVSFTPAVAGLTFSWNTAGTILTVGHNPFAIRMSYNLTIAVGAVDLSTPGNPIALMTVLFTTGSAVPSAPTLTVADSTLSDVQAVMTWTAPTTFVGLTGWVLLPANITGYLVYRAPTCATPQTSWTNMTPAASVVTGLTFTATGLAQQTAYCFFVRAVTTNGLSAVSAGVSVTTKQTVSSGDLTWLWILLIIIIVVVVIALILWSRRKKPEAVPPAAPAAMEEPAPGAPAEETTPPEEGGETGGTSGGETGGEGGTPPA